MRDNKDILKEILSETTLSNESQIRELNNKIDVELSKPNDAVDSDLVKDCVDSILSITGVEMPETALEQQIDSVKAKVEQRKTEKLSARLGKLAKVATIFFVFIASASIINFVSVKAFQVDLFEGIVEFGKDTIIYNFSGNKRVPPLTFETSEGDPYGLIRECGKHNLFPLLPTYIPDGYNITNFQVDRVADIRDDLLILFSEKKHSINFAISFYKDPPPNIITPSKGHSVEKKQINGIDMYISEGTSEYTATFIFENGVYSISSDMNYKEFMKTLESLK